MCRIFRRIFSHVSCVHERTRWRHGHAFAPCVVSSDGVWCAWLSRKVAVKYVTWGSWRFSTFLSFACFLVACDFRHALPRNSSVVTDQGEAPFVRISACICRELIATRFAIAILPSLSLSRSRKFRLCSCQSPCEHRHQSKKWSLPTLTLVRVPVAFAT